MRFAPALVMLATAIGMVNAAPAAEPVELGLRSQETKTDKAVVDVCSERDWKKCTTIEVEPQHQCYNLTEITVKSVKVPPEYRCRFWASARCNGDSTNDIGNPGAWQLQKNMEGRPNSIKCYSQPYE